MTTWSLFSVWSDGAFAAIFQKEHQNWHKLRCPNILILHHNFNSTSAGCLPLHQRGAEAAGDRKAAQGWQMALDLKAAVVPLAESLQWWSVLLASLLQGWRSRELHLPGKSLLLPFPSRSSLWHVSPKPSTHCPAANRLCPRRQGRGTARVAQQISCRDLFTLPFPSCIILDLRWLLGLPLEGAGAMAAGPLPDLHQTWHTGRGLKLCVVLTAFWRMKWMHRDRDEHPHMAQKAAIGLVKT